MSFDLETVDRLLSTTRSVRKRLDLERPVEPEIILECLQLAVQAPTGSNSQSWRWLVVTDPDKRARLAEMYNAIGRGYLSAGAAGAVEGDQTGRVLKSALYLADHLAEVPVHLIPCVYGRPDASALGGSSLYGSILPAVWSFQLALRSRGLGSCYTTLHLGMEQEANELLGVPDNVTQCGLVAVAYTKGTDFKPADRPPVTDITYWNTWKGQPHR
jgi:nitroreductase